MGALTMLVPLWARWLALAALIATLLGVGFYKGDQHRGLVDDKDEAAMKHDFDTRIAAGQAALTKANQAAFDASRGAVTDQSQIDTAYLKGQDDERAASKTRTAQLLAAGRVRVDATCTANAGSRQPMSGAAAAVGGPDGASAGYAELSDEAVGRFEAAAGDTIGPLRQKVIGLQARVASDIERCNQVSAPTRP